MEFVPFGISLSLILIAMSWRSKAVAVLPTYQGACKIVQRAADCNRKQLVSIPQDIPADTEELFLDINVLKGIANASLQRYRKLWSLSLSQNNLALIERGAFLMSTKLSVLNLESNCIFVNYTVTAAALQSLPNLKKLDLANNSLTEDMVTVLLRKLSSLESLSLARNFLMRLDPLIFGDLRELTELNLERNYIYEIEEETFQPMWRLLRLNLAYNHITCIVDFSLTQLRVLNASYNSMEWFLADESNNDFELETLDLSHNQLLFFPILPKKNKLRLLLLSDNRMSFYENLTNSLPSMNGTVNFLVIHSNVTSVTTVNIWEDIILGDVSSLAFLDLSRNQFWYLPVGFLAAMTSLSQLKLNHNCFQTFHLTEQEPPSSLFDLDLSQNQLSVLQTEPNSKTILPNLRSFNLSSNRLQKLPRKLFNRMPHITTIDVSHNRLHLCPQQTKAEMVEEQNCVDFKNVASLKHLYLAGCGVVVDHAFSGTSLTHLDLSSNYGALIDGMRSLQEVSSTLQFLLLRNTGFSSNTTNADFSVFQNLLTLDLSENSLFYLPLSLSNLQLHTLDLRSNHLQTFPVQMVQQQLGNSLRTLYLSQNPYDCCKLSWWHFLRNILTIRIADSRHVTCIHSTDVRPVLELPESVLQSCRWKMTDTTLLYLVLTLPTCLTLLVALFIVFLTFRDSVINLAKRRCRSASY